MVIFLYIKQGGWIVLIKHSEIRNPIVSNLNKYMEIPVIQSEETGEQPPYPFMTFSLNSPYLPLGHNSWEIVTENDKTFTRETEHFEQVYSFTIIGEDEDDVQDNLMKAIQFFKVLGVQDLKDNGIAIVEVYNAQKRDTFLTIDYERRAGFDVKIRVAHNIDIEIREEIDIRQLNFSTMQKIDKFDFINPYLLGKDKYTEGIEFYVNEKGELIVEVEGRYFFTI